MSLGLANYLSHNGFKVIFLSHEPYFNKAEKVVNENGELVVTSWSSKQRPTRIQDVLYFIKVYKKYKPDYIIGHFAGANISIPGSKILSFGKAKTFAYYHTLSSQINKDSEKQGFTGRLKRLRKRFFYNAFVDTVICPSNLSQQDIVSTYKHKSTKTQIILNAIEDRQKRKNPVSSKSNRIAYLGRLAPSKNVSLLVDSFIEFKERHVNSDLELSIAGSGKEAEAIKTACDTSPFCNFKGTIDYMEVDSYLSDSDYTIIPSISDNLPTVGIESMMNSTPVIISEKTGLSQYCTNNVDSIVISPDRESMIRVFKDISDNVYHDMTTEVRKLFERKFSMQQYCKEIESLLNNN